MILWRVSNFADLKGIGGIRQAGRWHNAGRPIVYLSEHPALALLEIRVHLNADLEDLPDSFQLLKVDFDESFIPVESLDSGLSREDLHQQSITQRIGDSWLNNGQSPLLKVPSIVVPHSYNYLLNPLHPDSGHLSIVDQSKYPFDQRLFK
ncbi:RES family NAD+ phosphorylase [Marinomonas sp. TI.3.20]|uniref:RES family NAD+ phosphorylase n=1 Tax=Marinomonas sp. TI.3.20 TaxID=3121296 RepID=UPI00311E3A35